jgi:hypothetical protein
MCLQVRKKQYEKRRRIPGDHKGWEVYKREINKNMNKIEKLKRSGGSATELWKLVSEIVDGAFDIAFGEEERHKYEGTPRKEKVRQFNSKIDQREGSEWQNKLWKGILEGYGEDESIKEVLDKIGEEDEKDHERDNEEVRRALEIVTKRMMQAVVESPAKFWEVMRKLREGGKGCTVPGYMREVEGDKLEGDEGKVGEMWRKTYHRKAYQPKTEEGKQWRQKIARDVRKYETKAKKDRGRGIKFTVKRFSKGVRAMKKDGSPGSDLITARLLNETDDEFKELVADMMRDWIMEEDLPDQFGLEIVVPLFKRGSIYIPKSYRPVSLVQVGLKGMQTEMYYRVNKEDEGKSDGLTGDYNFGSVKGRDRHMAIWLTNLACSWEEHTRRHKGMVVMMAWDADNAFPSLYQDGVDWLMWNKGVRGKVWLMLRKMEKRLKGKIRVNGNYIEMQEHEDGGSQGAVAPPHRWKYMMGQWFRRCTLRRVGVWIGSKLVPGVGFVDDITMEAYTVKEVMDMVEDREVFGDKWGVTWKETKDSYVVRGNRNGMKEMIKELEKKGLKVKTEAKLLGEWMGSDPDRCPKQVEETIKAMKKAAKGLEWLVWRGSVVDGCTIEGIFEAMVGSIAQSHLIHTRVTDKEWERIEAVKASVGRKFLGVHKRASRRGVLSELGWTTIQGRVWKAKIGFFMRLRKETGMLKEALNTGVRLVEEGTGPAEKRGFLGGVKRILEELKLARYWQAEAQPRLGTWKKMLNEAIENWEWEQWEGWKRQKRFSSEWAVSLVSKWERGEAQDMGTVDRQLLAGIRLMMTREEVGKTVSRLGRCELCGKEGGEGIVHLVAECTEGDGRRRSALGPGSGEWSKRKKWAQLTMGGSRGMHMLRWLAEEYKKVTSESLMPWVGSLGSRKEEGMVGMSVLVQQVSKWVEGREREE